MSYSANRQTQVQKTEQQYVHTQKLSELEIENNGIKQRTTSKKQDLHIKRKQTTSSQHTFIDADVKELYRCAECGNNKPELHDFIESWNPEAAWHG